MSEATASHLAQATRLEASATELEAAARHCRVAAAHFQAAEVPRAAAHTLAAIGHLVQARDGLEAVAADHAHHAQRAVTERTNAGPQSGPAP